MLPLNKKLNELFKESVQLRKDDLRLRLKLTEEVGKEEILIFLLMKPIDNMNHKDWSPMMRINGLIRLNEKKIFWNNYKQETESTKRVVQKIAKKLRNYKKVCCEQAGGARQLRMMKKCIRKRIPLP